MSHMLPHFRSKSVKLNYFIGPDYLLSCLQHPCGISGSDEPHAAVPRRCTEEWSHEPAATSSHLLVSHGAWSWAWRPQQRLPHQVSSPSGHHLQWPVSPGESSPGFCLQAADPAWVSVHPSASVASCMHALECVHMSFYVVLCALVLQEDMCTAHKSSVSAVSHVFCMLRWPKKSVLLCWLVHVNVGQSLCQWGFSWNGNQGPRHWFDKNRWHERQLGALPLKRPRSTSSTRSQRKATFSRRQPTKTMSHATDTERLCNTLQAIHGSAEDIAQLRIVAVNQVLGTDMKKHFDITSRFQVGLLLPMLCLFSWACFVCSAGHALRGNALSCLLGMLCLCSSSWVIAVLHRLILAEKAIFGSVIMTKQCKSMKGK